MEPNDLEKLLPCPFCGGRQTEFHENGRVWAGMKYSDPISVSVRHWCEEAPGPSRMIERIGRDKEQAIERWNMRSNAKAQRSAACGASAGATGCASNVTTENNLQNSDGNAAGGHGE